MWPTLVRLDQAILLHGRDGDLSWRVVFRAAPGHLVGHHYHIDAASGGLVAPFLHPDLNWGLRLPLVKSTNASGHIGLVYPGIGWVVRRSHEDLLGNLVFHVNCLGDDMPILTLNFSHSGNQVVGQYYNFLRRAGFLKIMDALRDTAIGGLSSRVAGIGPFERFSDGRAIPVFVLKLKDEVSGYSVFDISDKLRQFGWQVPDCAMPKRAEDVAVLRIVVREGFSADMADKLLADFTKAAHYFEGLSGHAPKPPEEQFVH